MTGHESVRRAFWCAVLAVGLSGGVYIAASYYADVLAGRLARLVEKESRHGRVQVTGIDFEEVTFRPPIKLYLAGLKGRLRFNDSDLLPAGAEAEFLVEKAAFTVEKYRSRLCAVRLRGIQVRASRPPDFSGTAALGTHMLLRGREGKIVLHSPSFTMTGMEEAARHFSRALKEFIMTGRAAIPMEFSGTAFFPLDGTYVQSRIFIENRAGVALLRMNEDDVMYLAEQFDLKHPLNEIEADLVASNPLKAPSLLDIRRRASRESEIAHSADRQVPEDAYRHVLWSYLLARKFGAEFAEKVTGAHEEGMTGNTEAEKAMDLQNNKVGIGYALSGRKEQELLRLVMTDPQVVRQP